MTVENLLIGVWITIGINIAAVAYSYGRLKQLVNGHTEDIEALKKINAEEFNRLRQAEIEHHRLRRKEKT